jgi:hypothetical protein
MSTIGIRAASIPGRDGALAPRTPPRIRTLNQSVSPSRGLPAYGEQTWGCSPPRRARTGRVIVERVVERVALVSNFPIPSKTNYADWAAVMHVML